MARTTGSSRPPTGSRVTSPSKTRRTSFVWRRSRPSLSMPWRSCTSPNTARGSEVSSASSWLAAGCRLDNHDQDVADLPAGFDVPVGLDDLVQWISAVDHRLERSGLHQLPEVAQLLLAEPRRDRHLDPPAAEQ